MQIIKFIALSISMSLLLSACGDDGAETPAPKQTTTPPTPKAIPKPKRVAKATIETSRAFIDQDSANNSTTITVRTGKATGGDTVIINTSLEANDTLPVTDNGDGSYTAALTPNENMTAVTVTGTVNGTAINGSARIAVKVSMETVPSTLAALGEKIFTDTNLSTPPGQSCASCHDVSNGFDDVRENNTTSEGAKEAEFGGRNTPTASYAAHIPEQILQDGFKKIGGLFWDGRADSLEEQARQPLLDSKEMGNPDKATVIGKISAASYADDFKAVFGANSLDNVDTAFVQLSEAIAAFERTRVFSPFTSKWDAVAAGTATFTPSEAAGFEAFKKGNCDDCHLTPDRLLGAQVFSNFEYENVGTPIEYSNPLLMADSTFRDFGMGSAPADPADGPHSVLPPVAGKGQFKVPTLRNIAVTGPYMHNGIFKTLEQVIAFYNSESITGLDLAAEVGDTITEGGQYVSLLFTQQEEADLKVFLEALTDAHLVPQIP